jgi:hypothetical protein
LAARTPSETTTSTSESSRSRDTRRHVFAVSVLVLVSGALRLMLASGFVLGDDPAYADLVSQILRGTYPAAGPRGVFVCRPLMLYPLAASVRHRLFGWSE